MTGFKEKFVGKLILGKINSINEMERAVNTIECSVWIWCAVTLTYYQKEQKVSNNTMMHQIPYALLIKTFEFFK